jgi:CHAD domain-containing protein
MALTTETRKFAGQNAARLLGRLAFQMNLTMKSPNADSVHDVRVAIRRFTQALTVFKPCFRGKETRKIRRRLKKLMLHAGNVRNCDVALKTLSKARMGEAASLRPKVQSQRKENVRVLVAALRRRIDRKSSLKWRTALESALATADDAFCRVAIEETARRVLPAMAKDFLEHGNAASEAKASPEKLHQFRIASKKYRYTLELFTPLYGESLKGWLDRVKSIQSLLGDINDCVTVAEIVAHHKVDALSSWLKKRARRKTEEFCRRWQEVFGDRDLVRGLIQLLSHPQASSPAMKKPVARSRTASRAGSRKSSAVA